MCRVIAVANQKGGVSKTTTAEHLGIGLVNKGFKVLLIDGDAQGSLTSSLGWKNPDDINYTLASVMDRLMASEDIDAGQGILHHEEGVDLLPGNIDLSVTEANLISVMCRESILRSYVSMVRDRYDFIIIDCTPSLGMLTINALTSADSVIVPITAAYLPTRGLQQLLRTIGMVKKRTNKDLYIEGILIAMADMRTTFARDINAKVRGSYGKKVRVFETIVPRSVKIEEASAEGISIFRYEPKCKAALAYENLTKEVLYRHE